MYKVAFYPNSEEFYVHFKEFETAEEAFQFAELRGDDILEIKKHGTKTNNIQERTHDFR